MKGRSSEFPKKFFHESAFHSDSKCGKIRTLHIAILNMGQ